MSEHRHGNDSAVLTALANERRRVVLRHLGRTSGPTSVSELAERVSESGPYKTVSRTRAAIELYHVHLPQLDVAGLIEYDADRRLIEGGPELESGLALLEHLE
ncbi:DUF7344 domain-containing protein [Halobellus litoreus]|uniref:DUF7344 domain-containing protein n=1 Tax=Halobellus litoreus TaxID=755310 RepID=A0ABD6DWM3_9EURY|nr:hypothetical protein [Halobellus litoreus]